MKLQIDGCEIEIDTCDTSIIDSAERAGIKIPDPCHKNGRADGCCKSCVVEIDGVQKFACSTKPEAGMNIIFDREDLKELRSNRLKEYNEKRKLPKTSGCCCSGKSECC